MNAETKAEREYIYGYGKTKHIKLVPATPTGRAGEWGLCGAPGGYPLEAPDRPVCKRCEKIAAREGVQ